MARTLHESWALVRAAKRCDSSVVRVTDQSQCQRAIVKANGSDGASSKIGSSREGDGHEQHELHDRSEQSREVDGAEQLDQGQQRREGDAQHCEFTILRVTTNFRAR